MPCLWCSPGQAPGSSQRGVRSFRKHEHPDLQGERSCSGQGLLEGQVGEGLQGKLDTHRSSAARGRGHLAGTSVRKKCFVQSERLPLPPPELELRVSDAN